MDEEVKRAVRLIDKMVGGLGFLPMSWEEVFDEKLVTEIKSFMRAHSEPGSLWRCDEEAEG